MLNQSWKKHSARDVPVTTWNTDNPKGVPCLLASHQANMVDDPVAEFDLACSHAGHRDILFLVYGGGKAVQDLCMEKKRTYRHEYMAKQQLINKGEKADG